MQEENNDHSVKTSLPILQQPAQGLDIQRIHQAWVTDITYLDTDEGFVYLALLTDVYSRRIVGFDVSDSLSVEEALRALQKAFRLLQEEAAADDRGGQYACYALQTC